MKLLLDTHVWLWQALEPERVRPDVAATLANEEQDLFLSPVSVWETLVLAARGRVELQPSPREFVLEAIRRTPVTSLPITTSIALRSQSLDDFGPKDPMDRFLVATALEHDLALVTADAAMLDYKPLTTLQA